MPRWRSELARLTARWLGEAAVHLLPSRCFACGGSLPRVQLLGACATCWVSLASGPTPRCFVCALPLPDGADPTGPARGTCLRCAIRPGPIARTVAAVGYDPRARRFLLTAKNGHRPELFRPLAGQLAAAVSIAGAARGIDGIVPVPTSLRARWRRGFNPARELASGLADSTGLPLFAEVLRQPGLGSAGSKGLGATARWARTAGRFTSRRSVVGMRLLLVDDVMTTGATAAECASCLRAAGALEVRVAVWARTPFPGAPFDRPRGGRL